MGTAIDWELWHRASKLLGRPRAVTLWTCPRCSEESLIWSGRIGGKARCLNKRCGLEYDDFAELIEGEELYRAAKHEEEIKKLMRARSYRRGSGGAIRQVGSE